MASPAGEPAVNHGQTFRLKCPKCQGVMVCDESILDTPDAACSDCGHPVEIGLYEPLLRIRAERAATKRAAVQREREERERLRQIEAENKRVQREKEREAEERRRRDEVLRQQREQFANEQALKAQYDAMRKREKYDPATTDNAIPQYVALEAVAAVFEVSAYIWFGLGGIAVLLVITVNMPPLVGFGAAVGCAIWGLISLAICHGIRAFRDIAQNSWKQVILLHEVEKTSKQGIEPPPAPPQKQTE